MWIMGIINTHDAERESMRTNNVINDRLMKRAIRSSGLKTKRATVEAGLKLLLDVKAQRGLRRLRGNVAWQGNLRDMRAGRVRKVS
jgi:Arc/MetJ family transcription regulator